MTHPIPDSALELDIAILGKKGKGKTYAAKGLVERVLKLGRRAIVIDPMGVWWGLRSSADGKSAGLPIAVFGGEHADLPLTQDMGERLGNVLGEGETSAVLDVSQMTKAAMVRFLVAFLHELYRVNRRPLWLVLEEADLFAPQNPMGETATLLGEVDRIARRGRAFGFRLITMTQRPARLHKDVLTQLSTLVALGVSSPQDRDALKSWVEGNADRDQAKAVFDSLAKLKTGEAWIWAPDLDMLKRVQIPKITTLDTSATPKAGKKPVEAKALASIDLAALQEALGQFSVDVESSENVKAETPVGERPLRRLAASEEENLAAHIAEAERRGYELGLDQGKAEGDQAGYLRGHDDGQRLGRDLGWQEGRKAGAEEGANAQMRGLMKAIAGIAIRNEDTAVLAQVELPEFTAEPPRRDADAPSPGKGEGAGGGRHFLPPQTRPQKLTSPDSAHHPMQQNGSRRGADAPFARSADGKESLTPAKQRILTALRQLEAIRKDPAERTLVAWFSSYSPRSSGFEKMLSALSTAGLISYPSPGMVALTTEGKAVVPPERAVTHADLMALISAKQPPAQMRVLNAVIAVWPGDLSREELAERTDYSDRSSGYEKSLGRLRSLGLVDYPKPGRVRAADLLFPGGRR